MISEESGFAQKQHLITLLACRATSCDYYILLRYYYVPLLLLLLRVDPCNFLAWVAILFFFLLLLLFLSFFRSKLAAYIRVAKSNAALAFRLDKSFIIMKCPLLSQLRRTVVVQVLVRPPELRVTKSI